MLNAKVNWFFLKISIIVMRKLGVVSCNKSGNQRNKKLGRFSLFVQNFVKPKISEKLNSESSNSDR